MAAERVLVVDDSHTQRVILDALLTKEGYDVVCARDGLEAIQELEDQLFIHDLDFSFIIMDVAMPRLDGYGLVRKLADRRQRVPAIILISDKGQEILDTAVELANAYGLPLLGTIRKPVSLSELTGLLQEMEVQNPGPYNNQPQVLANKSFIEGIGKEALTVAYQPIVSCKTGALVRAECLARWRTAMGGVLGPASFLPIAQGTGYLSGITHKTIIAALRDLRSWRQQGHVLQVSVNITTSDICDLTFTDFLKNALGEYEIEPHQLTLELSELDFNEDFTLGIEVMGRLRLLGIGLALDDFGTGFDPLMRLKNMPFNELKSDVPFLRDSKKNRRARVILEMTVELARRLDITCTCEGVETHAQWQQVKRLGATQAQGYFISPPLMRGDFLGWAETWRAERLRVSA